jgi:hypothetical protein
MAKQLRFSLRWLLLFFTLLTVVFYLAFVGPATNARKFADAVNQGNADLALSLAGPGESLSTKIASSDDWPIVATVLPRDWDDICKFRCRVRFYEAKMHLHRTSEVVFGPFGKRVWWVYL